MSTYTVYMLSNERRLLYTGYTSDLAARVFAHKQGLVDGFTKKYRIHSLVWFETTNDPTAALEREWQIKGWSRKKKIALINAKNPEWRDLYHEL